MLSFRHTIKASKNVADATFQVYIFAQQKVQTLWLKNVIIPLKIKNRKAAYSFAPRPLIFKLLQEVLKFNDTCLSWSFPKTDMETNFVNLENQSFENISFSQ